MVALSLLDYVLIKAEYAEETRESRLKTCSISSEFFSNISVQVRKNIVYRYYVM